MDIIVTGALGHIGSFLIRRLPEMMTIDRIRMIDNLTTNRYCSLFNLDVNQCYEFIESDLTCDDLNQYFSKADLVIHLAALTDAVGSLEQSEVVFRNNLGGTARVVDYCRKFSIPLIYVSSTSVYGAQAHLVDEDHPFEDMNPGSPYAESKLKEEELIRAELVELGRYAILRFGTICGASPGMRFHTAVNKFCWQAVTNRPLSVWNAALDQVRPYLSLADATQAMFHLVKNSLIDNQIYNVVTENKTVGSIILELKRYYPSLQTVCVESPLLNQTSYNVSTKKIERTGFIFSGSVSDCIQDTLALLKNAHSVR